MDWDLTKLDNVINHLIQLATIVAATLGVILGRYAAQAQAQASKISIVKQNDIQAAQVVTQATVTEVAHRTNGTLTSMEKLVQQTAIAVNAATPEDIEKLKVAKSLSDAVAGEAAKGVLLAEKIKADAEAANLASASRPVVPPVQTPAPPAPKAP